MQEKLIKYVKGVGPKKEELFNKLDIKTDYDLLRFYPKTYENWSEISLISDCFEDEISTIKATVQTTPYEQRLPGGRTIYKVIVYDDSGDVNLTFFNNRYIPKLLKGGETYLFRGKITTNFHRRDMLSPDFHPLGKIHTINPIYRQTEGLSSRQIANAVSECLKNLPKDMEDTLNSEIRKEYKLCHFNYAIENIHFPMNIEAVEIARKRLIFEELLVLQLGMRQIREKSKLITSHIIEDDFSVDFEKLLPYTLTGAQKRAVSDCIIDFKKINPMNRLLQGDVGSGKTAVAASLCFTMIKNGMQCAMMAPTEILAGQHYNSLKELLQSSGITTELLTGSLTPKRKREIYTRLENGEIDLLIGTHALISEGVTFKNLGLVITDEQHRFGVKQRSALLKKGIAPHILVMSATPIPRTLALMVYGDLDISVLDELPPNRQKIETYAIPTSIRQRAFAYLQKHLDEGRQAYIVCPLIEDGESELNSIESYFEFIKANFKEDIIGVLHGKMKSQEKEMVMFDFSSGKTKILLSTTVIEVGVDVPNAVLMIIENAERFGLSQLHQLRGRVGRGKYKSTCILISDAQNEEAVRRLKLMKSTSDGFKIAEEDLKMRGPGDFFGKRQHGLPKFKIADMASDMGLLKLAQDCAIQILNIDPDLENNQFLKSEIARLFKETDVIL